MSKSQTANHSAAHRQFMKRARASAAKKSVQSSEIEDALNEIEFMSGLTIPKNVRRRLESAATIDDAYQVLRPSIKRLYTRGASLPSWLAHFDSMDIRRRSIDPLNSAGGLALLFKLNAGRHRRRRSRKVLHDATSV